jgi:hypothetical protein
MNLAKLETPPVPRRPPDTLSQAEQWQQEHERELVTDGKCKCKMLKKWCLAKQERFRHTWTGSSDQYLTGKVRAEFIRCVRCRHFKLRKEIKLERLRSSAMQGLTKAGVEASIRNRDQHAANVKKMNRDSAVNAWAFLCSLGYDG